MTGRVPSFDLERFKALVAASRCLIRESAQHGAGQLGLHEQDIFDCVLSLDGSCFHKSMPAERCPGLWQDVYRPEFAGFALYVKVQIVGLHPRDATVVISFKRR